uniref:Uncharacterized protein n=1 Tax=Anguilla anguilla TaxID=7936 RepID=A0A0E9Q2J0_ANGAN
MQHIHFTTRWQHYHIDAGKATGLTFSITNVHSLSSNSSACGSLKSVTVISMFSGTRTNNQRN